MTLDEYLNESSAREEAEAWERAVDHFVAEGLGHVKNNFESECRLPPATWERVFIVLKEASEDQLQAKLTFVFREHTLDLIANSAVETFPA